MTRVLHVIGTFAVGGIERLVFDLATASRAHGVQAEVLAFQQDGPLRRQLEDAGVPAHFVDKGAGVSPRLVMDLAVAARRMRADVVHAHHIGPWLYGGAAAKLLRAPLVYTEHSREMYSDKRLRMAARALGGTSKVVAVSEELATWWSAHMGLRPEVVRNGVRVAPAGDGTDARRAIGLPTDALVVGCVARLSPEKDHASLLRAVALIPRVELVLVGDGSERVALEALAAELGLGERAHFLGSRDDVAALLPAFDVFALTSTREGLPLALLEAMAAALPCVVSAVGEMPAVVAQGCGRTVPPGDVVAISEAIRAYQRHPARAQVTGARARERVIESYSLEATVARYAEIYQELTASTGR